MSQGLEITRIWAGNTKDSQNRTVLEAEVELAGGAHGKARILRRSESAAGFIRNCLSKVLLFENAGEQEKLDGKLWQAAKELPGTPGGYGALVLSMAITRAAGAGRFLPLYRYLGGTAPPVMPLPMMSMIRGKAIHGRRENWEILVIPKRGRSFADGLFMGNELSRTLKEVFPLRRWEIQAGKNGLKEGIGCLSYASLLCGYQAGRDFSTVIHTDFGYSSFPGRIVEMEREGTVSAALFKAKNGKQERRPVVMDGGRAEEDFLADMAVAAQADYVKMEIPCTEEGMSAGGEFLRIEEFYGRNFQNISKI